MVVRPSSSLAMWSRASAMISSLTAPPAALGDDALHVDLELVEAVEAPLLLGHGGSQ